ncbi:MAG: hypothetical protein K6G83_04650 [Lachnospiraceae bacterium]|nr:hypothetical protein [Lachnospiraceae bacterium]
MNGKKLTGIILSVTLALLFTACGGGEGKGNGSGDPDTGETGGSTEGIYSEGRYEGKVRADVSDLEPWSAEGKHFVSPDSDEGYWALTGHTECEALTDSWEADGYSGNVRRSSEVERQDIYFDFDAGSRSSEVIVKAGGLEDYYRSGGQCRPRITFQYPREDEENAFWDLFGSVYFADMKEDGNAPFGQSVTIRDYCYKYPGRERALPMKYFSIKNELCDPKGVPYNNELNNGYFEMTGNFPKMIREDGDKIFLVLDLFREAEGDPVIRNCWEYTWVEGSIQEEEDEDVFEERTEKGDHAGEPDWTGYEYAGKWTLKDIQYIGPVNGSAEQDGISVEAKRYGVDGQKIEYRFANEKSGEPYTVEIPELYFGTMYDGDYTEPALTISCNSNETDPPGSVICAFGFCDVEFGTGEYGIKMEPKQYFTAGWPEKPLKTFGPIPHDDTMSWRDDLSRALLRIKCSYPEGHEDGEITYLVYGVMDDATGKVRMYNVYEYEYQMGPITEWVYNPPMPD